MPVTPHPRPATTATQRARARNHYSLELGVFIEDRPVIAQLERIFDHLFLKVAVRADAL